MRSLDDITRDLARTTDDLLALSEDDFEGRHRLLSRQDELRQEARRYDADLDGQRPVAEIRAELAEVITRRDAEVARVVGRNMMSGPGGTGGAAGAVSGEMVRLALQAKTSSPIGSLNARIAALESALAVRGIDTSAASESAGAHVVEPDR